MAGKTDIRKEIERILKASFVTVFSDATSSSKKKYRMKFSCPDKTVKQLLTERAKERILALPHVVAVDVKLTKGAYRTFGGILVYFDIKPGLIKLPKTKIGKELEELNIQRANYRCDDVLSINSPKNAEHWQLVNDKGYKHKDDAKLKKALKDIQKAQQVVVRILGAV